MQLPWMPVSRRSIINCSGHVQRRPSITFAAMKVFIGTDPVKLNPKSP